MKKRLLVMLLLLCLLLTALTATVSAFTVKVNGEDVRITFGIDYHCDICKTYPPVNDDDYTINSFQAYTEDGKAKPLAEWKYGDGLVLSVSVKETVCTRCTQTKISAGTFDVVVNAADVGHYCHKPFGLTIVDIGNYRFRFSPVDYLFSVVHHIATPASCEYDGYNRECWRCSSCGMCLDSSDPTKAKEIPDNVIPKTGHKFDDDGNCTNAGCTYHAEAYISYPWTEKKTYCDTVANAISNATAPAESVHVVSYERDTPITINKVVDLTVEEGVTVPEIRLESLPSQDTGNLSVKINNHGTVRLFSMPETVKSQYQGVSYFNHNRTEQIKAASTIAVRTMQILNTDTGIIGEINISQTDNPTPKVQVTNNGGTITTLSGSPKNVALCTGTGSYGTIQNRVGSADSLLNTGCYFYFPNDGQKWANKCAESKVSGVIVSEAPFTVTVNRDTTALALSEDGSYTVDGVNVNDTVALSAAFALNEYGLKVNESEITSRWYYSGESKNASEDNTLTLNDIQYGVYDLIFEAKESTYGFTTSVNVKVNMNLPQEKTKISLKEQPTSVSYTKVYNGTKDASAVLPPIEFQLADEREIRISPDYYNTPTVNFDSPDCIPNNKIIVEVTLTEEGKKYYDLTNGKIEVPATITPYDGEWYDGVQHYKAFFVGLSDAGYDGSASIGRNVLPYLQLKGNMYDAVKKKLSLRNITPEDGFQYSFYHLRPGAKEPDPELDELLTADSVFTYPEDEYHFYAVVKPSLNYAECITGTSNFKVRDTYSGAHTHDSKTYAAWDGSSLSIATGGTATRYLSGAQANVNVELALSQKKTLNLCLYNKSIHVIGSSHDQIYLVGGSTLVLSDCRKTGKVIGSAVASGSGGVAYVKNGTLSVYDVTLTGGIAKNGGAIVVDKDGTLNLYSGEISGNYVTGGNGGAIYVKSGGVVNMYGGTIRNNHAYSGDGGAIYVEAGGTLNLFGGEISGNTSSDLGGGIYVEAGGRVNVKGAPIVKDNTANGKPSNLYICANSSSPLLTIDAEGLTTDAQIGVSTNVSCPMLLARGMQTDYSAHFIPDDANTFVFYTDQALTLCAKPTATLKGDTLTITTGSGNMSNTFVLLAAEYDTDGKMLAVHSWNVAPQEDTYTCDVKNPGVKIKCFLLRYGSNTPVLTPFSPLA